MKKSTKFQLAQFGLMTTILVSFIAMATHAPELATYKTAVVFGMLFVPLYVYLDGKGLSAIESEFDGVDIS